MKIKGKQLEDTLRSESAPFDIVYADRTVGDLKGAIRFTALNNSGITIPAYNVVYIDGNSGNLPTIKKANASQSATMPAFGLTVASSDHQEEVDVVTFGNIKGVDTSTLSVGDVLYVSTSDGLYTTTPPSGSNVKLQNIGMVVKSDQNGIIKLGGAGRTNATPNLDQGEFFLGDSNNRSVASPYTLPTTIGNSGQVLTSDGTNVNFADVDSGVMTVETITLADTTQFFSTNIYDFSANSVDTFYIVETEADKIFRASVIVTNQTLTVGQRIKIYNKGGGTLRLYENSNNTGPNLDPTTSSGTYNAERDVNSKALVELIATGTYKWEYVIIPQLELDESTLTTTGEVFAYDSTELAMKALPYTFPVSDGSNTQILSTNGSGGLSFIDQPSSVPSLSYTALIGTVAAADFGGTNYRRPFWRINLADVTINLPVYTDSNASSLNGQVIEIINEAPGNDIFLKIATRNHGNSQYTRLYTSAGAINSTDNYTYTIPPSSSLRLSIYYGASGSSDFLTYTILS
jgi:hypothetical protein